MRAAAFRTADQGARGPICKEAFAPLTATQHADLERLEPNSPDSWVQIGIDYDKAALLARSFMVKCQLGGAPGSRSSFFHKLVLNKAHFATRIWNSAFVYLVAATGNCNGSMSVFVRLRAPNDVRVEAIEDDHVYFVDVIAVTETVDHAAPSMAAAYRELECVSRLLRQFCPRNVDAARPLCPMCCGSDLFVRQGLVHAFHAQEVQEVSAGSAVHCSRYHHIPVSDLLNGRLMSFSRPSLPRLFPGTVEQLKGPGLDWYCVGSGGVISSSLDDGHQQVAGAQIAHASDDQSAHQPSSHVSDTAAAAASEDSSVFCDGMFSDASFFVLTGQVAAGDTIASEALPEFRRQLSICATQDCHCDIALRSGVRKTLRFSYSVGETILNSFVDKPIQCILPADIGDAADHPRSPRLQRFCAHDNVLVVFGPLKRGSKFLVFPGSRSSLRLCRLTPAICNLNLDAAACWTQVQDNFSISTGTLLSQFYEITALTLLPNHQRGAAFLNAVDILEQRSVALPSTPHWCKTPSDVAACLGSDMHHCRAVIERANIDGAKLASMTDAELHKLADSDSVGNRQHRKEFFTQLKRVKDVCEAQVATMLHFDESISKVGVRSPNQRQDVNLTVAWWGNARANAVYLPVAQNGFVHLPRELRFDTGDYGSGFYFTHNPRYSDYYISGCKHFARAGDDSATFLMSYVACGRPFPVTQHPGHPLPLKSQPCNQQSPCGGGAGRHDSHYVCVKFDGQYFPCPPREQPDYDEIIVFHTDVVLPAAVVEFKRRRRTLLWLDDRPENNFALLRIFPGCPQKTSALSVETYPMQQHCAACGYALTMDPNPNGTLKQQRKAAEVAQMEHDTVLAAARAGNSEAQARLQGCIDAHRLAEAALACAQVAAAAVAGDFAGRDIKMEEQIDVVLFTSVNDLTRFLRAHPEMSGYPSSLFRIIVSSQLHLPGFFDFMDTHDAWRFKFPATLVFFAGENDPPNELSSRPNFQFLRNSNDFAAHLYSFAQFLPWNACQFSVNHQNAYYQWLIDHPPEQELHCSYMNDGDCAAEVLAQTVNHHPGCACNLLEENISAIAQHMRSFSSIVKIDVSDNPSLGDTGVELFLRTAVTDAQAQQLVTLDLSRTGLTDDGVYHLQPQIQRFPCLKHLNLSLNPSIRFVPYSLMRLVLESFFISWGDLEQGWVVPEEGFFQELLMLDFEEPGTSKRSEQAKKSPNRTSVLPSVKVLQAAADHRLVELQLFLNSSELKCLSGADVTRRDADIVAQWLPHFSSLTLFDISDNPLLGDAGVACILSAITESQARQLVALNLSSTGLTREGVPDLSRQLQRFASVQNLELRNAFVDETVFAFICHNFRCLTSLNVRNNPLVNVPPVVSLLTKLKSLYVSGCRSLTSFPDEIYDLKKTLLNIRARNCTGMTFPPPSIVEKGAKDIFEYIKNAQGQPPLKRVKVLFLGNGRTGKTSLLSALAKQPLRPGDAGPDSTVGVTVNTLGKKLQPGFWESLYEGLPDITFWDFAGQLEYSAAHDFFLSTRQAVYVIVFSVMEDRESQMNQVAYWLRTVATRGASEYVRFLMVGTKVDMIEGEWSDVEKKLQSIEADMKSVVRHCCGAAAVLLTRFNFVTSMGTHSEYNRLRTELKRNIKEFCKSIFVGDRNLLRKLRFPKEYSEMRSEILRLSNSVVGLPMLELKSFRHGPLKDAHKSSQKMCCLRVVHDVGELILYESEDEAGAMSQSICLKPQFVADIIAEFAESNRNIELQRGCARAYLEDLLKTFLGKTKSLLAAAGSKEDPKSPDVTAQQTSQNVKKLFEFLLALRVFVPVYAAVDAGTSARQVPSDFIVPSALKGRPSFWREVFGLQTCSISSIRGVRYMCLDRMITVAAFVRAMTALCSHPNHMWGCAFLFQMHKGGHLFVRLAESRAYIDIVVLGSDVSQLSGESVDEACVRVTMMLRCNLDAPLWLCPQCCASDMFARSGAAHAFHREQLFAISTVEDDHVPLHADAPPLTEPFPSDDDRGGPAALVSRHSSARRSSISVGGGRASALSCSRFHEVSESGVLYGQSVGSVGGRGMPALYPSESAAVRDALPGAVRVRDTLSWMPVSCCGLAEVLDGDGEVLPNSFFVLSLQLSEGDKMCAQSMRVIDGAIRSGAKTCVVQEAKQPLKLEYSAGDCIGSNVIESILPCLRAVEIKSVAAKGVVTTKQAHTLRVDDQVLLSVRFDADGSAVEGVRCQVSEVINDDQLVLARVDPAGAAALPLAPDVTIMPICSSFSAIDNVLVVYKRIKPDGTAPFALFPGETNALRILRLQPSDCSGSNVAACWREVEDNWAIMLGHEVQNYEITGMTLFRCEEREKLFLQEVEQLESIRRRRPPPDFSSALDDEKQKTERAVLQQQVMGHFSDFSQKFSLLPVAENTDVNLSVAWWGKWPAVYHGVAQNGFWNLPSHLKIDPGYFGEGFYLTRYPRYSDYYINGFSLSKRKVEHGNILMCYTALGRPYPITEDPFSGPPFNTKGPPAPRSCCGKACGAACSFTSSGDIDSHDSHYVTVKMHPQAEQYFPCPVRQQPDFDEIVVFKPQRILPSAYVTFQRRRKTLLWLDDHPDSKENSRIRSKIPGASWLDELAGLDQPAVKVKSLATDKPGVVAVRVMGASGPHADTVNGVYVQNNSQLCCGQPVYCKQGDSDTVIEYDSARLQWQVKDAAHRGKGGWALASVAHSYYSKIGGVEVTCCDAKEFTLVGDTAVPLSPGGILFEGERCFGGVELGVTYHLAASRCGRNGELLFSVSRDAGGPSIALHPQRAEAGVAPMTIKRVPSLEECSKSGTWKVVQEQRSDRISYTLNPVALDQKVVAQPINHEDQVDVTLFKSVAAMTAFLSDAKQAKFAKYPPSLFRIVSNRRLFLGQVTVTCCDAKEFMCFGGVSALLSHGDELTFEGERVFGGVEAGVKYYLAASRSSRNGEFFSVAKQKGGPPVALQPQRLDADVAPMSVQVPSRALHHFLETNATWKRAYPATCLFHGGAGGERLSMLQKKRPNFLATSEESVCAEFVSFESLAALGEVS